MKKEVEYPHFVKTKDKVYVSGWYMEESDIEKVKILCPNGAMGVSFGHYFPYKGKELIDAIYKYTKPNTRERIEVLDRTRELLNNELCREIVHFYHDGYMLFFNNKFEIFAGKSPSCITNKYCKVRLLKKVPANIQKCWDRILAEVIHPVITIVEEYK